MLPYNIPIPKVAKKLPGRVPDSRSVRTVSVSSSEFLQIFRFQINSVDLSDRMRSIGSDKTARTLIE
jgi:hypothetical protein